MAVATVLYFLLRGFAGEKKKKLPVTLQDPTVKYPLRLVDKQVEQRVSVLLLLAHTHSNDTSHTVRGILPGYIEPALHS